VQPVLCKDNAKSGFSVEVDVKEIKARSMPVFKQRLFGRQTSVVCDVKKPILMSKEALFEKSLVFVGGADRRAAPTQIEF
jgi:hypothetical protein